MAGLTYDHLRVLVVEDNPHMRALLKSLLHSLGMKYIFEADEGGRGFFMLCDCKPDLVLTDLSMSPVDGITFTRRIRCDENSPNPYIPIVMITGHTERQRVEAARDAGITEFLAKPITAHNLILRLAEIVERPRPFIRSETYFGPDRRRRRNERYNGPWRRSEDRKDVEIR